MMRRPAATGIDNFISTIGILEPRVGTSPTLMFKYIYIFLTILYITLFNIMCDYYNHIDFPKDKDNYKSIRTKNMIIFFPW